MSSKGRSQSKYSLLKISNSLLLAELVWPAPFPTFCLSIFRAILQWGIQYCVRSITSPLYTFFRKRNSYINTLYHLLLTFYCLTTPRYGPCIKRNLFNYTHCWFESKTILKNTRVVMVNLSDTHRFISARCTYTEVRLSISTRSSCLAMNSHV